jgi:sugar lactone lactonase YvrE
MKKLLILPLLFLSLNAQAKESAPAKENHSTNIHAPKLLWEQKGFKNPESMLYDKERDVIYVSNVDGNPTKADGKGSIALLSADGKTVKQDWISGLNAPKGLALVGNTLYVADIDTLVEIDVKKRKIVNLHPIEKAKFLNDVVADKNGDVYVSDFLDNTIYRLHNGKFEKWLADKSLETPNGLFIEKGQLLVGSWGVMTDGFATKKPGHMKSINLKSKKITSLGTGKPIGNLDGIESDGKGGYFATDWMAGSVLRIMPSGKFETLLDLNQGSADLGIINGKDSTTLLVPMMNDNLVRAYQIAN